MSSAGVGPGPEWPSQGGEPSGAGILVGCMIVLAALLALVYVIVFVAA